MIRVISTIAIAICLLGISGLHVSAQFRDYIVTFTINNAVDSRALGGAQVQASSRSSNIPSINVLSDAAGRVTLYLLPGQYLITVRHKGHQAISFVLPVPGAGMQNQMRQTYGAVALKEVEGEYESDADWRERRNREKAISRTLSVTVLGAKRDKNGKTTNASIAISSYS